MQKIIQIGAEATILLDKNTVIKRRLKKSYRIEDLDEKIRKLRTRSEAKLLEKASKLVPTPQVTKINEKTKEILMDFIDGKRLSEHLDTFLEKEQRRICKQMGKNIANLHDSDIIHGDLTTSNMILNEKKIIRRDSKLKGGVDKGDLGSLKTVRFHSEAIKETAFPRRKGGFDKGKLGSLYILQPDALTTELWRDLLNWYRKILTYLHLSLILKHEKQCF